MKKKIVLFLFLCCILCFLLYHWRREKRETMSSVSLPSQIVIDIGHGGEDPGKIGVNGALEKDVNLAIGKYLNESLLAAGYTVTMTRYSDTSLADPGASNQKLSDFQKRTALINEIGPAAVISIHQNSYPQESINGAQVFHSGTPESEQLALCIQNQLRRILDPSNERAVKKNNDYYLFRHTSCPIVIVECGFLSNYTEANLLITETYQRQTAWAIHMGTVQFLKSLE